MMQPQSFRSSWLYVDNVDSANSDHVTDCSFIPNTICPDFSSSNTFFANVVSNECMNFQVNELDDFPIDSEELNWIMNDDETMDMSVSLEEISDRSFRQTMNTNHESSLDHTSVQPSVTFCREDEEKENEQSIFHLIIAYGEAMEANQPALAEVIVKRLNEKLSLLGGSSERLLYYAFQPLDKQKDYLKVESTRNFDAAFKAFYQIFPYGRFAHFAANSAILEAMPQSAEIVHIFDFDIGSGLQWSTMIEAIGRLQRELRLTLIKWSSDHWNYEDTKRRLYDHARDIGVKLKVDEVGIHDLSRRINRMKKKGDEREWFAFNCMANLPHMGMVRSRKNVGEFLRAGKELLCRGSSKGVIAFGDGDHAWEKAATMDSSFGSFLNETLAHYQCLLESMKGDFPAASKLREEARTAMEYLFVAPFVSSRACTQKWEERDDDAVCDVLQLPNVMEGLKVSEESLMEVKEMVREGESLYRVVRPQFGEEMILEWRNTPLVRVSCWRNRQHIQERTMIYVTTPQPFHF